MQSNGRVDYTTIPETIDETLVQESYPYIPNLNKFIESYLRSTEPVLILVGAPGTGKTKLLRHVVRNIANKLIASSGRAEMDIPLCNPYNANGDHFTPTFAYTNDSKAVSFDEIFVDFIGDGDIQGLVLEDMDSTLKPRTDGNDIMSKLLSSSDGFISNYNKKMILTSNIVNINTIDAAFKRPGRCYGMVKTRKLNKNESLDLLQVIAPDQADKLSISTREEYTIAELYKLARESVLSTQDNVNVIGF